MDEWEKHDRSSEAFPSRPAGLPPAGFAPTHDRTENGIAHPQIKESETQMSMGKSSPHSAHHEKAARTPAVKSRHGNHHKPRNYENIPPLSKAALERVHAEHLIDASPLLSPQDEDSVILTERSEESFPAKKKPLNIWRLVALAFVFTCSGPFGVEAALRAAGPGFGLLGLVLTPIVFVLPQIVMVAELATMIPSNQGYVAWVTRGLGDFWGFINAFSSFAANLLDMSVYCTLFSSYVCVSKLFQGENSSSSLFGAHHSQAGQGPSFAVTYAIRLACNLVASSFALLQSKHVAEISTLIGSVVMAPFVIGFFMSAQHIRPNQQWMIWKPIIYEVTTKMVEAGVASNTTSTFLSSHGVEASLRKAGVKLEFTAESSKRIDWALWGSTLCWLYTGWNSLGNLAAEVRSTSTYTYGMTIATVLDVVAYLISVVAALTVDPLRIIEHQFSRSTDLGNKHFENFAVPLWQDGYLVLAMEVMLAGLGSSIAVAASLSIFGILINSITCYARATAGMAELGWLPACLAYTRGNTQVPYNSVFLFAFITAILSLFEFDILIKVDSLLAAQGYILTFISFLRLRYNEKDTHRPYKVPFGSLGAWVTSVMKIGVMFFIMLAVILDSPTITWLYIGFNVVFVLSYVFLVKK